LSGAGLYKIDTPDKSYVLRIQTTNGVNPQDAVELFAFTEASKIGLSPSVFYVSPDSQAVLMEFINLPTLTLEVSKMPLNIVRMANAIRLTHGISGNSTESEGLLSKAIRCHKKVFDDGLGNRKNIDHALEMVKVNLEKLVKYSATKVHLHGDLNPRNIFITNERVLFIDWTETSYDDPFYDLSYFSMKHDFDDAQESLLVSSYLQRKPTQEEEERFVLLKKIQQAFWSLTNLYLADVELSKNTDQVIDKEASLQNWGFYQKLSADCIEMTAQNFYDLSRLNYRFACDVDEADH
jgi:tRNA A-37 threonylcarbamoyl transferase component Bud32